VLLPLEHDRQAHKGQHDGLEPRVFGQQDGDVAHKRDVAHHTTHDIGLAVQKALASGVEFGVVCRVVVAFGQEL
jgi:hypothetical protein